MTTGRNLVQDQQLAGGQVFRQAWIDGVTTHFPGEPKPGYVAPWGEIQAWEQDAAATVYDQVRAFLATTDGNAARLSRAQKGQFVAACWTAQIYQRIADPKPSYVADWSDLPAWQQETDADIFERIEHDHAANS